MRFLIADDHELFLKGLELLLKSSFDDVELVCVSNYDELFSVIKNDKRFDLVLTDLAMPGSKWENAINHIYNELPNTPIVILSAIFEDGIIQKTIDLGVGGYIIKTTSNKEIIEAINVVLEGGVFINKNGLEKIKDENFSILNNTTLTSRQIDILKLIAKGMANKNIAYELGLTEGTVKIYVTNILKNLNVNNRTAAVLEAKRQNII